MKIIAHRGFWRNLQERNTQSAFEEALANDFGIETDFRDFNGTLVISHDPAVSPTLTASDFFSLCNSRPSAKPIAINVKADGLQKLLVAALRDFPDIESFVFDMSIPDTMGYIRTNLPIYLRCSEYEQPPLPLLNHASGIWLDAFSTEWYDATLIDSFIELGKAVCIVSPELHGRPFETHWQHLRSRQVHKHPKVMLCTDHPAKAKEFFHD